MGIAMFTAIVIVVPLVAVLLALAMARFSDRVARGISRRWRIGLWTALIVIYFLNAAVDFHEGSKQLALLNVSAGILWGGIVIAEARKKPDRTEAV